MTRHILEPVEFKHLLYGRRDTVATITINRPDNRNALGTDTVKELRQAFDQAKHDEAVRVIILTGAGKVFCAGADLQGFMLEISELDRYFQRRNLADLFLEMTELGKPTIARVNGHALAGGFGLVAACDLAIASDAAQFGMPEVNVGVWPMMIMAIVFRNVPRKAGMELMLTGKRIDADEAVRIGLINRHVPLAQLDSVVIAAAAEVARKGPAGQRLGVPSDKPTQPMAYPTATTSPQAQLAVQ